MLLMSMATWMLKPLQLPVNSPQNLSISFDPELSFKKQIDTVVKNRNFQGHYIYALRKYLDRKCLHL